MRRLCTTLASVRRLCAILHRQKINGRNSALRASLLGQGVYLLLESRRYFDPGVVILNSRPVLPDGQQV